MSVVITIHKRLLQITLYCPSRANRITRGGASSGIFFTTNPDVSVVRWVIYRHRVSICITSIQKGFQLNERCQFVAPTGIDPMSIPYQGIVLPLY